MPIKNYIPEEDFQKAAEHFFVFGELKDNWFNWINEQCNTLKQLKQCSDVDATITILVNMISDIMSKLGYIDQRLQLDIDYKKDC